ncbi:Meiotically up-regulated protein 14 [Exophiala dermatitidis]
MSSTTTLIVEKVAPAAQQVDGHDKNTPPVKPSFQALSQGPVVLRGPPTFSSVEKQRQWMLGHMAAAFRVFARKGFTEGLAGHTSLRDPEFPDCFWTNPIAHHFGLMKVSDLILLNDQGQPIGGNTSKPANAAGFQIHGHIHRAYPEVNAACHAHSVAGRAWASFGRRLDMLHQDACNFYGDAHQVYTEFGGVVLDPEEGNRLAAALGPRGKGLLLQNHGFLTVGKTVDEAAYLFCLLDTCCEIQLKAEAAAASGIPKVLVSEKAATFTYETTSNPEGLYNDFQPEYEYELAVSKGDFLN